MDFLIGGLAGAGATIVTNPLDVIKTRMQLQGEMRARGAYKSQYRGIAHALYVIARNDGIMALQKGLVPAMLLGLTMNSVRLGTYRTADLNGWTKDKQGDLHVPKAMFWASLSGMLSGVTGTPASVLKTRIQAEAHPSIAVGRQHKYKGLWDGCVTIYRTEGIRGFFAGMNATCVRLAIGSSAQLTSFSVAKVALKTHGICDCSPTGLAFAASSISGVLVSLAMCPFDVITIRLYNQAPASSKERLYHGVWDCLRKIYKTEGFLGLYKGLFPLYLRLAPHTTLSLVIWDTLSNFFQNRNKNS